MPFLNLAPTSTALVLIDLQNGIAGLPLAPHTGAEVVKRSARLASRFREKGASIVFVRVSMTELQHLPVDAPHPGPKCTSAAGPDRASRG